VKGVIVVWPNHGRAFLHVGTYRVGEAVNEVPENPEDWGSVRSLVIEQDKS